MEEKRQPVIQVKNLYKIFRVGDEKVRALNGVDLTIYKGEFCAIVGTSGSPILNRVTGVPSNCCAAWIKYLPSVQSPAISGMMTAVPAEPVNPVIYFLHLK